MTTLTQSQHIMSFIWLVDSEAIFSYGDEDDPNYFHLSQEAWEDMGRPKSLTVTIQPGDLLND